MGTLYTPTVGVVYKFSFQPGYTAANGTYRLVRLMQYDEYLADGGDLLTAFYEPNEKTENDLNRDLPTIRASSIMKLVSPNANDDSTEAKYAPVCFLQSSPDYNVREYSRIGILAYVGVTTDPEDYTFVADRIKEAVEATLGITEVNPKLVQVGTQWLTDDEYQAIVAERDQSKIKTTNYYADNVELRKRLASAQTIINEYEKIIVNYQNQVEKLKEQLSEYVDTDTGIDEDEGDTP